MTLCHILPERRGWVNMYIVVYRLMILIDQPSFYGHRAMYAFTQLLHHGQDVTQGRFLSGVQLFWIQSFLSPRSVAAPKLKSQVYPTIYPYLGKSDGFMLFPRALAWKWSTNCLVQELNSDLSIYFFGR